MSSIVNTRPEPPVCNSARARAVQRTPCVVQSTPRVVQNGPPFVPRKLHVKLHASKNRSEAAAQNLCILGFFCGTDEQTSMNQGLSATKERPIPCRTGVWSGAESQNRTGDTRFFRPVLYRLSYLGATRSLKFCDLSCLPSGKAAAHIARRSCPGGRPAPVVHQPLSAPFSGIRSTQMASFAALIDSTAQGKPDHRLYGDERHLRRRPAHPAFNVPEPEATGLRPSHTGASPTETATKRRCAHARRRAGIANAPAAATTHTTDDSHMTARKASCRSAADGFAVPPGAIDA
jgi:hypothetical protein